MKQESKVTHTAGPWFFTNTFGQMLADYKQPIAVASHDGSNLIAGIFGDGRGGEDAAKANARLISAAPELLEALRNLTVLVTGDGVSNNVYSIASELSVNPESLKAVKQARTVIAKAEGKD